MIRVRAGIAGFLAAGMACVGAPLSADSAAPGAPAPGGEARPPLIPVATFAQRDQFANPAMSPDGARVAVYIAGGGKTGVKVLLLAAAEKAGVQFEQLVLDETGHGFEKPEDEARWLARLKAFLKAHNPAE